MKHGKLSLLLDIAEGARGGDVAHANIKGDRRHDSSVGRG